MKYLGDFLPCQTVYIPLNTFDSSGASVTMSGLAVTGIEIYRDGSITQRSSDSGYTLLDTDGIDLDSTTGLHGISIDLSDNTDSGFFAVGHDYWVQVNGLTIDSQSVATIWACFSICNRNQPGILLRTTIASVTDQTHIALTTGPASDDWLNNTKIVVRDKTSGEVGHGAISDYTASGYAVVLLNALPYTIAVGDNVEVFMTSTDLMATPSDIVTQINSTGISNITSAAITDINSAVLTILGTPADTDIATDISNIALGSGVTEAALIQYLVALGDD